MNEEDKKRLARYMKFYVQESESSESGEDQNHTQITTKLKQNKLGFIDKIEVKEDVLVNNIMKYENQNQNQNQNQLEIQFDNSGQE